MPINFEPYQPEEKVTCKITRREGNLLMKLRNHEYGKFIIHKIGGKLIRIEISDSQLIEEQDINL